MPECQSDPRHDCAGITDAPFRRRRRLHVGCLLSLAPEPESSVVVTVRHRLHHLLRAYETVYAESVPALRRH